MGTTKKTEHTLIGSHSSFPTEMVEAGSPIEFCHLYLLISYSMAKL